MRMSDVQVVLVDWIGKNMLSAFPEYSWQKFLAYATLPGYTAAVLDKLKDFNVPGLVNDNGLDLDVLRGLVDAGFSSMDKVKLPSLLGETFWISKKNAEDLLMCLRQYDGRLQA